MSRRTLGDDLAMVAEFQVHPDQPARRSSQVVTPCCGRETAADCIQDFRGTSVPENFLCDGCRGSWHRDPSRDWTRASLLQAAGAPWETVRQHLVLERVREIKNRKRDAGESYTTNAVRAQAEADVPDQAQDVTP